MPSISSLAYSSSSPRIPLLFLSTRLSRVPIPANHIPSFRNLNTNSLRTFRPALQPPSNSFSLQNSIQIRPYAKKSRFSPGEIYQRFIKQSMNQGSWEIDEYESHGSSSKPYIKTSRSLKESLAAKPGSDNLDYIAIKSLLVQLLTELPAYDPHSGTPNTSSPVFSEKKIISNAFSVLLSSNNTEDSIFSILSFEDIHLLYQLMVDKTGNIFSNQGAVPIIPNLFSLLNKYATHTSNDNSVSFDEKILPIHLSYFKYLSNVLKIEDSDRYLKWLLTIHHPENNQKMFDTFLHSVSFPEIERTAIPALFRHIIDTTRSKRIGVANTSDDTLFTPLNQSFVFALSRISNYHNTFQSIFPEILHNYPFLYSNAEVVSIIFDALNNKIRKVGKSQEFLKSFLNYHNNNQSLTELDQILCFDDQDKKLAFHRQLAISFIKYGPKLTSPDTLNSQSLSNNIDIYLNQYIPNTFPKSLISDIELYKSLKNIDSSSTASDVITVFQNFTHVNGEDQALEISHTIVNNAFDILSSRGFDIADNFDDIHEFFEKQLGFESSIDTFDCLIIGALNNNFSTTTLAHDNKQAEGEMEGVNKNGNNTDGKEPIFPQRASAEKALLFFEKSILAGTDWTKASKDQFLTLDNLLVQLAKNMPDDVFRVFKAYQRIKIFRKKVGYLAQAELLKLFLSYNYIGDVEKFLTDELGEQDRPNIAWDSEPEIYQTLFNYASSSTNYKDAWLIYGLSEKYYASPYQNYCKIMSHFCSLGRPDAALLIFKNVRNRSRTQGCRPPDERMYSLLFREFGLSGYELGVNELHTMYKVDICVEPSVNLMNSIMEAYTALDDPGNAIEMWSQIKSFPGGPNNQSYTNVLKLCTKASIHDVENMWHQLLSDEKVKLDEENVKQYLIANCYHGFYSRALQVAKDVSEGTLPGLDYSSTNLVAAPSSANSTAKYDFSESTLASLYNWTLLKSRKDEVSEWARENFPEKWENLQASGSLTMYLVDEENKYNDSDVNLRKEVHDQMKQDDGLSVDGILAKNLLPAQND